MSGPRVGITLQALMRSTRLKRKPLLELRGREMIAHQIDRLKTARIPEVLILCTSDSAEDDPLAELGGREGVEVFRGPKEDVLLRLTLAAEQHGLDWVIAPAGDNPLTCAEHVDDLAAHLVRYHLDYADGVGVLPIGLFAKGCRTTALRKACEIKSEDDTEGWMAWFTRTRGIFRTDAGRKMAARSWVIDDGFRLNVQLVLITERVLVENDDSDSLGLFEPGPGVREDTAVCRVDHEVLVAARRSAAVTGSGVVGRSGAPCHEQQTSEHQEDS